MNIRKIVNKLSDMAPWSAHQTLQGSRNAERTRDKTRSLLEESHSNLGDSPERQ